MTSETFPSMSSDNTVPELNPRLDRVQLARTFARERRVHVANVLTDASARRLHYALQQETPWGLILNEGKKVLEFETVSAKDYQVMSVAAWERAHSGFQYFYHHYRLFENRKTFPSSHHYHAKLVAFLAAPDFCAFIREVTGLASIALISSTATLYRPRFLCCSPGRYWLGLPSTFLQERARGWGNTSRSWSSIIWWTIPCHTSWPIPKRSCSRFCEATF